MIEALKRYQQTQKEQAFSDQVVQGLAKNPSTQKYLMGDKDATVADALDRYTKMGHNQKQGYSQGLLATMASDVDSQKQQMEKQKFAAQMEAEQARKAYWQRGATVNQQLGEQKKNIDIFHAQLAGQGLNANDLANPQMWGTNKDGSKWLALGQSQQGMGPPPRINPDDANSGKAKVAQFITIPGNSWSALQNKYNTIYSGGGVQQQAQPQQPDQSMQPGVDPSDQIQPQAQPGARPQSAPQPAAQQYPVGTRARKGNQWFQMTTQGWQPAQ